MSPTRTCIALIALALLPVTATAQTPRSPAKLFAAACATCHGADGRGGPSWTDTGSWAPPIAYGLTSSQTAVEEHVRWQVRNGAYLVGGFDFRMPAFGLEVISDVELDQLVQWLVYAPPVGAAHPQLGVPAPPVPQGRAIVLEILDEAPWYRDDGSDTRDMDMDTRRVVLSPGEYVKVYNRGKTWHTVSNSALGVDTGFIGYSNNIPGQDVGYYYLEATDLADGDQRYYCALHPYMQVQIVTAAHMPMGLTHVSKLPLPPPRLKGLGELWVGLQTFAYAGAPNGAVDVFHAKDWSRTHVPHVGNNPHNGWSGKSRDWNGLLRDVVVFANWHDVTATVLDASTKQVIGDIPMGAATAHVMTAPRNPSPTTGSDRWFLTVMGNNRVQEFDPLLALQWGRPDVPALGQSSGAGGAPAFSPHGLWFLDDGDHFMTANTLGASASLYSISRPWTDPDGRWGVGAEVARIPTAGRSPLAAGIVNTGSPGSTAYVGFTNNAGSDDVSVYSIDATAGSESLVRTPVAAPLGNAAGNLALSDVTATPVRWAHMPIQAIVSPPDANGHRRFLVVCNKASFNVSIVPLDAAGQPTGVYTFPAGLGCHGVAFGRKATIEPGRLSYFAYVTNTFENYVGVYDLERLERLLRLEAVGAAPLAFRPGGATERVLVEGHAALALTGQASAIVPLTTFSPDARGLVHVGDLPLTLPGTPGPRCYLQEHVWVDVPGWGMTHLDLDLKTDTGAMGLFVRQHPLPW